jgi:hypothetical protein
MSNVRSQPLRDASTASAGCVSVIGTLLLLVSTGPLFFLLNGGYSIVGMAWLSEHTGAYGRLFWQLATTWTIDVPIAERAGLPLAQPVIPWLMVFGISFLEIGLLVRRMRRGRIEPLLDAVGGAASAFDFVTTAIGLVFAPFVASAMLIVRLLWAVFAIALAVPLTFGFEALLARLLHALRRPYDSRRNTAN